MHGAGGNLDHISASGADSDVYGSGIAPFYGTYQGNTLEEIDKGTVKQTIRADPRTDTAMVIALGWTAGSTNTYIYQGQTTAGTFGKPTGKPEKLSYSCTAIDAHLGLRRRGGRGDQGQQHSLNRGAAVTAGRAPGPGPGG